MSSNGSDPHKELEPCPKNAECIFYRGHKGNCRDAQGNVLK